MIDVELTVNGKKYNLNIDPTERLVDTLRERLDLTGVKASCYEGECGSCTVILDQKPVASCLMLTCQADGGEITTIEGLAQDGKLHPVQQAFIDEHGFQCGFCTPGIILSAKLLLDQNPDPTPEEITAALNGHICRCGNYPAIMKSVLHAAELMQKERRP